MRIPVLIGGKIEIEAAGLDLDKTYTFSLRSEDERHYLWCGIRPVAHPGNDHLAIFSLPGLPVLGPGAKVCYTAPRPAAQGGCYCDMDAAECERRGHPNRSAG